VRDSPPRPKAMPGRDVARGRPGAVVETRRSVGVVAGMLSLWLDEKVLEREDGMRENLRLGLPVLLESFVVLREKPNDVRLLDSLLCRGACSLATGPGMEVGGYDLCDFSCVKLEFWVVDDSLGSCG
jgi:hypothetical protein